MVKKDRLKRQKPKIMIDLSSDDENPGGANSVDAPQSSTDDHQPSIRSPRSGAESRPSPRDHTLISGLKPIGIGDKDGRKDRSNGMGEGDEDDPERDFFGGGLDSEDEFEPERLRGILPGLIKMGYRMGAKASVSDADAQMLSDQIIECAMSDDGFRDMLSIIPTDCLLTVGVTAFMIYLRSPKEGKNENTNAGIRPGRESYGRTFDSIGDKLRGESQGASGEPSDYKYAPGRVAENRRRATLVADNVWG